MISTWHKSVNIYTEKRCLAKNWYGNRLIKFIFGVTKNGMHPGK